MNDLFHTKERFQSYIIEVLAGFHDIRRAFWLIHLHPALTEELPAGADLGPRWKCNQGNTGTVINAVLDSLVGNTPEHDVIQQRDLFCQLHGRERLKTLGLRALRLEINTPGLQHIAHAGNNDGQWMQHTAGTSSDEEHSYHNEVQQRGAFLEVDYFKALKSAL